MHKYWWLWAIIIAFIFGLLASECSGAEKIGWDGMPVKEKKQTQRLDKTWHFVTATTLAFGFTIGDIEYSIHNINRHGAQEGNHWAKSYIEGGRAKAYIYGCGLTAATMLGSYFLFKSKDPDTQKLWIILPTICITGHSIGLGLNIAF